MGSQPWLQLNLAPYYPRFCPSGPYEHMCDWPSEHHALHQIAVPWPHFGWPSGGSGHVLTWGVNPRVLEYCGKGSMAFDCGTSLIPTEYPPHRQKCGEGTARAGDSNGNISYLIWRTILTSRAIYIYSNTLTFLKFQYLLVKLGNEYIGTLCYSPFLLYVSNFP